MYDNYKDLRQLERILNVLVILQEEDLNIEDVNRSYLKRFLSDEDIFAFYNMYNEWQTTKLKCKVHKVLPYSFKDYNNLKKLKLNGIHLMEFQEQKKKNILKKNYQRQLKIE